MASLSRYVFLDLVKSLVFWTGQDFVFSRPSACTVALQRYQLLSLLQLLLSVDVFMDECDGSLQIWLKYGESAAPVVIYGLVALSRTGQQQFSGHPAMARPHPAWTLPWPTLPGWERRRDGLFPDLLLLFFFYFPLLFLWIYGSSHVSVFHIFPSVSASLFKQSLISVTSTL